MRAHTAGNQGGIEGHGDVPVADNVVLDRQAVDALGVTNIDCAATGAAAAVYDVAADRQIVSAGDVDGVAAWGAADGGRTYEDIITDAVSRAGPELADRHQHADGVVDEQVAADLSSRARLKAVAGGVGDDVVSHHDPVVLRTQVDIVIENSGFGPGDLVVPAIVVNHVLFDG